MPTLADLRLADTLSADPFAIQRDREDLKRDVEGDFSLRDEAAGSVQHVLKAIHMAGQNHALNMQQDPIAAMLGLAGASEHDAMDLDQINERLAYVGVEVNSIQDLTPWALAYLIVDIVTLTFGELTEDLPTL